MVHCFWLPVVVIASALPAECLVVCPTPWRQQLDSWVDLRQSQGYRIRFYDGKLTPTAIRSGIERARQRGAKYVLLVGDAAEDGNDHPSSTSVTVPAPRVPSLCEATWNPDKTITSDHWYSDTDDDGFPDVAIGRLPVGSIKQLETVINKILAYERSPQDSKARRRVDIVAVSGDFGKTIDGLLENGVRTIVRQSIPRTYDLSVTYGHWRSLFCPDPRLFRQTVLERLDDGAALWVYVGHGTQRKLAPVRFLGEKYDSLSCSDIQRLDRAGAKTVALLFSCNSGKFDQASTCLAEEMVNSHAGPVAALCSSGIATPYGLIATASEVSDQFFYGECETWGELHASVKRSLLDRDKASPLGRKFDALAVFVNPINLDLDRRQHVRLMHLLGDPLLRIKRPLQLEAEVPRTAHAGAKVLVKFSAPFSGNCTIDIRNPLYQRPFFANRDKCSTQPDALAQYQSAYERSNSDGPTIASIPISAGNSNITVSIPASITGPVFLRISLAGEDRWALFAAPIKIASASESK